MPVATLRIVGRPELFRGTTHAIITPVMTISNFVCPVTISCLGLFGVERPQ